MQGAVLFDLDGLLIDSEPLWKRAEEVVLARHGKVFSRAIAVRHMGMRMQDCAEGMVAAYGLSGCPPDRFARELVDAFLAEVDAGLEAMPGAARALEAAARRGSVAIASSSPTLVIERAIQHFGWGEWISARASGDEVEHGKPAPDIFLLAAQRTDTAPMNCVVLEDSLNGVRAARAAGMECVAVPGPDFEPDEFRDLADLVLASLEEWDPTRPRRQASG